MVEAILALVTAVVEGTGKIVSGAMGVKQAKLTGESAVAVAKKNFMTQVVSYKGTVLETQMAPYLAYQEAEVSLANAERMQQTLILLGGGAMVLTILTLLVWTRKGKR